MKYYKSAIIKTKQREKQVAKIMIIFTQRLMLKIFELSSHTSLSSFSENDI